MGVVVAMDGPSGSGKSSTSRGVATRLGLRYLDTGAMFRAMTWWMLENGIDVHDAEAVAAKADAPLLVSGTDPQGPTITVDGTDVAGPIRSAEVTSAVSAVSAVPEVRERLLREQRDIIGEGDIVDVRGSDGAVFARGMVFVDSAELRRRNYYGPAPKDRTPYDQVVEDPQLERIHEELLASSGAELFAAAEGAGVDLLFEAAVAGGMTEEADEIQRITHLIESLAPQVEDDGAVVLRTSDHGTVRWMPLAGRMASGCTPSSIARFARAPTFFADAFRQRRSYDFGIKARTYIGELVEHHIVQI